jgi:hypothetical protein
LISWLLYLNYILIEGFWSDRQAGDFWHFLGKVQMGWVWVHRYCIHGWVEFGRF